MNLMKLRMLQLLIVLIIHAINTKCENFVGAHCKAELLENVNNKIPPGSVLDYENAGDDDTKSKIEICGGKCCGILACEFVIYIKSQNNCTFYKNVPEVANWTSFDGEITAIKIIERDLTNSTSTTTKAIKVSTRSKTDTTTSLLDKAASVTSKVIQGNTDHAEKISDRKKLPEVPTTTSTDKNEKLVETLKEAVDKLAKIQTDMNVAKSKETVANTKTTPTSSKTSDKSTTTPSTSKKVEVTKITTTATKASSSHSATKSTTDNTKNPTTTKMISTTTNSTTHPVKSSNISTKPSTKPLANSTTTVVSPSQGKNTTSASKGTISTVVKSNVTSVVLPSNFTATTLPQTAEKKVTTAVQGTTKPNNKTCTGKNCTDTGYQSNADPLGGAAASGMQGSLIAALFFGIVFVVAMAILVGKRLYDGYQRRHYSKVDYLINDQTSIPAAAAANNYETVE